MNRLPLLLLTVFISLAIVGCNKGPQLGKVTGVITLDGKPIEHATITFTPASDGWSAFDRTDAEGKFELQFQDGRKGAMVGENEVRIETGHFAAGGIEHPELLPAKYHEESEMVRTVKVGHQTFDFDVSQK